MITVRKSEERGSANHGWLNSNHTFSFANYYDPKYMGFHQLRVINEDRVKASKGFAPHSHQDMEIISYVLSGSLEHKDSMGNTSIIYPGEVQIMGAGTGVTHSEYNHSQTEDVHFLQIWILPNQKNLPPRYEQKKYSQAEKQDKLCLIVSPDGRDGSVTIHQDVNIYATLLESGTKIEYPLPANHHVWVQIIQGEILLNDHLLGTGDAIAVSAEDQVKIAAHQPTELLLFDLAEVGSSPA